MPEQDPDAGLIKIIVPSMPDLLCDPKSFGLDQLTHEVAYQIRDQLIYALGVALDNVSGVRQNAVMYSGGTVDRLIDQLLPTPVEHRSQGLDVAPPAGGGNPNPPPAAVCVYCRDYIEPGEATAVYDGKPVHQACAEAALLE